MIPSNNQYTYVGKCLVKFFYQWVWYKCVFLFIAICAIQYAFHVSEVFVPTKKYNNLLTIVLRFSL